MKDINPIQNIFNDIKQILEFIVLKDSELAKKYETVEYANDAQMWINAKTENDTFITYRPFWTPGIFQKVMPNVKFNNIEIWMKNPNNTPLIFREALRTEGRKIFLSQYEEKNNYYRHLNGLPPLSDDEEDFIYLTQRMAVEFNSNTTTPIHQLPLSVQNKFMQTDLCKYLIENKNKSYLKFIGYKKIDPFIARKAYDFEIIRYPELNKNINPYVLEEFRNLYNKYRDYVMHVLYNLKMEEIIPNYRNFMGVLIMFYTLMQLSTKVTESLTDFTFLDDSAIYLIFDLYGIPNNISITNSTRRKLVQSILKLVQNKGTINIYYDLIDILGYKDTKINQLYLVRNQKFNPAENYKASSEREVYFAEVDLKSKNLYKSITSENLVKYDYNEITDLDDEWFNDETVLDIVKNKPYSISNSKYISITTAINQFEYLFESVYLLRFLLDSRSITAYETIKIPELFGNEEFSLYELAITIIAGVCRLKGFSGMIDTDYPPLAVAGFNLNLNTNLLLDYVDSSSYIDKSKIELFIKNISIDNMRDITRIYSEIIIPMRDWIKYKITNSENRKEFIEYENLYKAIFTYDINDTEVLKDYTKPIKLIQKYYNISDREMEIFKNFYPHFTNGKVATNENIYQSQYRLPFLSNNYEVSWRVHVLVENDSEVDDRGYLYFYDILNSENTMELTNSSNLRIFMDYEDDQWKINQKAVQAAIDEISKLSDDELGNAFFQIKTPIYNISESFPRNSKLPESIRNKSIFKEILINKILMDSIGLSSPPTTFAELLFSKNQTLFNFIQSEIFNTNKEIWIENLMKIILALETNLDLYLKYFEQSVIGKNLFFKPLLSLLDYFKSVFIKVIKTNFTYLIDDKVDSGGNTALIKLFENIQVTRYFVILAKKGYYSQFGLFDAEKKSNYKTVLNDYPLIVGKRKIKPGSVRISDEAKFFKNNENIDPSIEKEPFWFIGESGTGRWSNEDDFIMKTRSSNQRVQGAFNFDFTKWKWFVETYIN